MENSPSNRGSGVSFSVLRDHQAYKLSACCRQEALVVGRVQLTLAGNGILMNDDLTQLLKR